MADLKIVRFALGLNDKNGDPLSSYQQEAATNILGSALSHLFGGCTIYSTRGFWDGQQEPSLVFEAFSEAPEAETGQAGFTTIAELSNQLYLKEAARDAALAANQEAVMLVVSSAPGAITFVGQPALEAEVVR
jgi:hypothetical protein